VLYMGFSLNHAGRMCIEFDILYENTCALIFGFMVNMLFYHLLRNYPMVMPLQHALDLEQHTTVYVPIL
jgi:hypothetical protein